MTTLSGTTTGKLTWRDHARIVWALTGKDVTGALKNKSTLTTLIIVILMVLFYRYFPTLTAEADSLPVLVYAESASSVLPALERSPALSVTPVDSRERLFEIFPGTEDVELALVVTPETEAQLARPEGPVSLDGYVMYWLSDEQRTAVKELVEAELAIEFGRPVTIDLQDHDVYLHPESGFFGFNVTIAFVFVAVMIGISFIPNLLLAEKKEKTLDVLRVSPASPAHIVAGKALAGLFYMAVGYVTVLAAFGYLVLQWGLVLTAAVIAALFMVAIGLLLGLYADVPAQLQLIAWLVIPPLLLPMILVALEGLVPTGVVAFLRWIPTVSVAKIFRLGLTPDAVLTDYAADLLASLAFTAVLLGGVVWMIRRQDRA